MIMDFAAFQENCRFVARPVDPLFTPLLWIRVWVGDIDELAFKLDTLTKLRTMAFYKRLKPALVEDIEKSLLGNFTPLSFWATCEAYGLSVRVVKDRMFYDCGAPTVMWRRGKLLRLGNDDLFEMKPLKPLFAVSYYSLADLKEMATKLGVGLGTKSIMYLEIQNKISLLVK